MQWTIFFSVMLLGMLLISAMFAPFISEIPWLNFFPVLLEDSSGFLTIMCIVAMIAALWRRKDKKEVALSCTFCALDIIIINKLYLNKTWVEIAGKVSGVFHSIENWDWAAVLIYSVVAVVVIVMLVWGIKILRKGDGQNKHVTRPGRERQNDYAGLNQESSAEADGQKSFKKYDAKEPQKESAKNSEEAVSFNDVDVHDGEAGFPGTVHQNEKISFAYAWIIILFIIPIITFIQWIFFRVLHLGSGIPENWIGLVDVLIYISTICLGIMAAIYLWIVKKKAEYKGNNFERIRPAVIAFFIEVIILILYFNQVDLKGAELLDWFLSSLTDNSLGAFVVIPIVLFVILYVGISILLNVIFKKAVWLGEAEKKIDLIQRSIIMFGLNVIIGILNLFLFIPDFFNQIGGLLLSNDQLFPEFERDGQKPVQDSKQENQKNQAD